MSVKKREERRERGSVENMEGRRETLLLRERTPRPLYNNSIEYI